MKKTIIEEIIEAPSIALEKTVKATADLEHILEEKSVIKTSRKYISNLGPGLVSGAADDDPSGIATYSQTGAQFGFSFLWLAAWTFPLMATIQEMCARMALVTGKGLAANIKQTYSKNILYTCVALLFFANTLNIGANLGAMAKAIQLVFPTSNFVFLVIAIGVVTMLLQIFITYQQYAHYLKWLALALLSYIATGLIINMDWSLLMQKAFIPSFSFTKEHILMITAVLGTTISPYLFFWQTSQEVEEEIAGGKLTVHARKGTNDEELRKMRFDVWSGMALSNIVMFFIIAVCGATLFLNGVTNIETAADAARALRPLAGPSAYFLFALGIVGTGMLAVPVLAGSTSYALSESFGWKEGLYRKLKEARAFYGVIIISIILGIILNFVGINPIKALIYSAIANGIIAPVILICIVHISGSKKVMGRHANSKLGNTVGWIVTGLMSIAAIATIISFFV